MEIICMQFCYYTSLSICIIVIDLVFGLRPHHGQLFSLTSFYLSQSYGFGTIIGNVINILFVIAAEAFIVEKANKCLDYTLTIFIIHLVSVWIYNAKFPTSLEWWMIHAGIITITTLLAELTCMRLE